MTKLSEVAEKYEGKSFRGIHEVDSINTDVDILEGEGEKTNKAGEKEKFTYLYFEDADGSEVRVPKTVLAQLKEQMKVKKDLKTFTVSKSGEGLGSKYTVVPLE